MRHIFFTRLIILAGISFLLNSCHSSAKVSAEGNNSKASQWFQGGEWLKGVNLKPHQSVNQEELYRQYQIDHKWWDEAFTFLKTHDLDALAPGVYVIDSGNVTATVTEHKPKIKEEINWEGHRNFNDLQYVIRGKVGMGVAHLQDPKNTVKVAYNSNSDVAHFNVENASYYDGVPGTFFIFTPNELHRPGYLAEGYDNIKKIVIKVRVPRQS